MDFIQAHFKEIAHSISIFSFIIGMIWVIEAHKDYSEKKYTKLIFSILYAFLNFSIAISCWG